ncbi:tRNA1(Val) (adenine(37)-N6)-methyltransferase [Acetilactobacillus jinshanensis]|uniref:SAM-dependent methyltransferase n=1 Tax=Acetilactobacillus jinshanensis TaxID=1720083 RepID=A0A4P6ZK71_9LACO|nr:methyltransferase [Acetilactobacillus jinshanensis]QBP17943.1 SAM-dependent methyltransferase [Acetilactobacillus jinshanensis]URL60806.1 methyltransferase [uncultured bacterium]
MGLKPNERIDELYSLGIKIIQNSKTFSFSLDAVLLAYFAQLKRSSKSLTVDLCAGNGAVGLFASHKTRGKIIGVEIQPKLADMAKRSVELNHLSSQIKVLPIDLKDVFKFIKPNSANVVLCNPPYFKTLPTTKVSGNPYLAIARSEIKTNLNQVISTISKLLNTRGTAFIVYRPNRLIEMLNTLQKNKLVPKAIQFAHPRLNQPSQLVLIKAVKCGKPGVKILPPIIVRNENNSGYSKFMHQIMFGSWNA